MLLWDTDVVCLDLLSANALEVLHNLQFLVVLLGDRPSQDLDCFPCILEVVSAQPNGGITSETELFHNLKSIVLSHKSVGNGGEEAVRFVVRQAFHSTYWGIFQVEYHG
jgi:hypothetical protein